ncbi:MAG: rhomboid family intramembrane serine protease [Bacilli bacterium]|nr:rhomboid family intramembrane serine protease [Bacilli bacterium]
MTSFSAQLKAFLRTCPVTFYLILTNTALFFVTLFTGGFTILNLARLGALVPIYVIEDGEYFRIVTSMFLHGSVTHFILNMVAIYFLGTAMEQVMGHIRYFALYFLSGIVAGVMIVVLGDPVTLTIGASGALYGIMSGLLLITLKKPRWFTQQAVRTIRRLAIINFAITFVFPNISIIGHVSGFLAGFLLGWVLMPLIPDYIRKRREMGESNQPNSDDVPMD